MSCFHLFDARLPDGWFYRPFLSFSLDLCLSLLHIISYEEVLNTDRLSSKRIPSFFRVCVSGGMLGRSTTSADVQISIVPTGLGSGGGGGGASDLNRKRKSEEARIGTHHHQFTGCFASLIVFVRLFPLFCSIAAEALAQRLSTPPPGSKPSNEVGDPLISVAVGAGEKQNTPTNEWYPDVGYVHRNDWKVSTACEYLGGVLMFVGILGVAMTVIGLITLIGIFFTDVDSQLRDECPNLVNTAWITTVHALILWGASTVGAIAKGVYEFFAREVCDGPRCADCREIFVLIGVAIGVLGGAGFVLTILSFMVWTIVGVVYIAKPQDDPCVCTGTGPALLH